MDPSLQPGDGPSSLRRTAGMALGVAFAPVAIAQQALPRSQPALYYVGVAALAATGVIEAPVAALVAAGFWVARHPRPPQTS